PHGGPRDPRPSDHLTGRTSYYGKSKCCTCAAESVSASIMRLSRRHCGASWCGPSLLRCVSTSAGSIFTATRRTRLSPPPAWHTKSRWSPETPESAPPNWFRLHERKERTTSLLLFLRPRARENTVEAVVVLVAGVLEEVPCFVPGDAGRPGPRPG